MSESKEITKIRGKWTPLNIISIIVGVVIFWPIGLFLLIWVLTDRDVSELGRMIARETSSLIAKIQTGKGNTGNRVFDEFQQTQMDRIEEIKKEITERYNAFRVYKEQRDRETEQREFEDFMRKKPAATQEEVHEEAPPSL